MSYHYLVEKGMLSGEDLSRAWQLSIDSGELLARVLVKLGLLSSGQFADAYAEHTGTGQARPTDYPESPINGVPLNTEFLRSHSLLPMKTEGSDGSIAFACADPESDYLKRSLEFALDVPYSLAVGAEDEISAAIERLYFAPEEDYDGVVEAVSDDLQRLRDLAGDEPVVAYADHVIGKAVERNASDIHIEPVDRRYRCRLRIDGVLEEIEPPRTDLGPGVISRLKIMAGLDIAERRLAQDGRIRHRSHGRQIDFRVSTTPTARGESIVLRLLDRKNVDLAFPALGFNERDCAAFEELIRQPDGIVLVTGPTGSGKTTTLYAALDQLNDTERKLLSVEDPVEYTIDGVSQVQVDSKIGRTFANTLRSFLRQDPDIIMVGEIRDGETARIAVQAALTGHLVLSTLHTNSAADAIVRLRDMGIEDYLIASTVRGVMAQRLVRILCPACRVERQPDSAQKARWDIDDRSTFFRASGGRCDSCGGRGYTGRTVIAEVMPIDDRIRELIQTQADLAAIRRAARQSGARSLFEDGLRKALAGETSLEEVLRVTEER